MLIVIDTNVLLVSVSDRSKFHWPANAECIVTNDKDFNVLKNISFPAIKVVTIEEFKSIIISKGILI